MAGVDRVERFEQRVGEALRGGQEGLVIAVDLDQLGSLSFGATGSI